MKTEIKIIMTMLAMLFIIGSNQAQVKHSMDNRIILDSLRSSSVNRITTINRINKAMRITSPGNRTQIQKAYPANKRNVRDHRGKSKNQVLRFDEADALFGKRTNIRDHRNRSNKNRPPHK